MKKNTLEKYFKPRKQEVVEITENTASQESEIKQEQVTEANVEQIITSTLKNKFSMESFRKMQKEIISALMLKNDVFVLLPTGAGKV